MSFNLLETDLVTAARQYTAKYPLRPIPYLGDDCVIHRIYQDPYTDLCRSHYEADSSGLKGGVQYFEAIVDLDFDSEKSRDDNFRAAADAAKKLGTILDKHAVPFRTYFSGSKGFHVVLPGVAFWPIDEDSRRLEFIPRGNNILKRLVRSICSEADVPESTRGRGGNAGWDASLYDYRRMVRMAGVPHGKSTIVSQAILGRTATIYKSPLPAEWKAWSIRQIVEHATVARAIPSWGKISRNPWLENLWEKAVVANDQDNEDKPVVYSPSSLKLMAPTTPLALTDLRGYPPCISSIRQGSITRLGLRNRIGISVCSFHASAGESLEQAVFSMRHVPSRSSNIEAETAAQWNGITKMDGKQPKDNYHFSNRSCRTLRACGATCTDQCPLHAEFMKGESSSSRCVPYKKAYDWGTVHEYRLDEV